MPIELPEIPAGILTLINLFAPYLIAVVNHPRWSPTQKRLVAVAMSLALTLVVIALYYLITGEPVQSWPLLLILGVLVSQTSHALITRPSASAVERATSSPTD